MVGKLYPTTDPNHIEPQRTANFMTQEDIGGSRTDFINDLELRNAPNTTATTRGAGVAILLRVGLTFGRVDQQPSMRQLYPIAELASPDATPTRAPEFMQLLIAPRNSRVSKAPTSIFAMRSWRKSSIVEIPLRSAR